MFAGFFGTAAPASAEGGAGSGSGASSASSSSSQHTVATYNMSFASDLTKPIREMQFASEATFLARLVDAADPATRRSYWINALNLLKSFLEEKGPVAVGLQEINVVDEAANTGTDAINQMLTAVNTGKSTSYKQISANVPTNNAGVSIVFDSAKLGDVKHVTHLDNPNQGGRPILMVITTNNYLLISIHGAQDPKLREDKAKFNTYMVANNTKTIEAAANTFITTHAVTPVGIYVMGDLNDRYDGIQTITIGEKSVSYSGKAPKSCCYNWDSSCPADRVKELEEGYETCNVPGDEKVKPGGIKATMGDDGAIANYRYAGDKVFGLSPDAEGMKMYRPDALKKVISEESDHELVYATFNVVAPSAGGYRKNYRKSKKARKNKRRATRRRV